MWSNWDSGHKLLLLFIKLLLKLFMQLLKIRHIFYLLILHLFLLSLYAGVPRSVCLILQRIIAR